MNEEGYHICSQCGHRWDCGTLRDTGKCDLGNPSNLLCGTCCTKMRSYEHSHRGLDGSLHTATTSGLGKVVSKS